MKITKKIIGIFKIPKNPAEEYHKNKPQSMLEQILAEGTITPVTPMDLLEHLETINNYCFGCKYLVKYNTKIGEHNVEPILCKKDLGLGGTFSMPLLKGDRSAKCNFYSSNEIEEDDTLLINNKYCKIGGNQ